jgi:Hydrolase of X-linked nucleoside diphosphate N terminal
MEFPSWLRRAQRLAALSQNGLAFTKDPFERSRWEEVQRLAAEMLADGAGAPAGQVVGGAEATSEETTAVGFFAEDALPPLSLGRVTEGQVRRMFEHARDASLPTDFD